MRELNEKIINILIANKSELLNRVILKLQTFRGSHYAMMDFETQEDREALMLNAFIQALRNLNSDAFVLYIEKIALQRLNEGYSLYEVQHAFRTFEENVWDLLTELQPVSDELIEMLKVITLIFSRGKDHLARVYLERSIAIQNELEAVRKRFEDYIINAQKPTP